MTHVYVDRRLLSVRGAEEDPHAAPGVAEALTHLSEAGLRVVVVDGLPSLLDTDSAGVAARSAGLAAGADVATAAGIAGGADPDAWLLTPDRDDCSIARRHGLRTVLVGPHVETRRPTDRCDEEARDLGTAALGILAADAMGGPS